MAWTCKAHAWNRVVGRVVTARVTVLGRKHLPHGLQSSMRVWRMRAWREWSGCVYVCGLCDVRVSVVRVVVEMYQQANVGELWWPEQVVLECVRRGVLSVWWRIVVAVDVVAVSGDLDQSQGEGEVRLSWLLTAAMRGGQSSRVQVQFKNEETGEKKGSGTRNKGIKHNTQTSMIRSIREQPIHYCTQPTGRQKKKKKWKQARKCTDRPTERVRERDRQRDRQRAYPSVTIRSFFFTLLYLFNVQTKGSFPSVDTVCPPPPSVFCIAIRPSIRPIEGSCWSSLFIMLSAYDQRVHFSAAFPLKGLQQTHLFLPSTPLFLYLAPFHPISPVTLGYHHLFFSVTLRSIKSSKPAHFFGNGPSFKTLGHPTSVKQKTNLKKKEKRKALKQQTTSTTTNSYTQLDHIHIHTLIPSNHSPSTPFGIPASTPSTHNNTNHWHTQSQHFPATIIDFAHCHTSIHLHAFCPITLHLQIIQSTICDNYDTQQHLLPTTTIAKYDLLCHRAHWRQETAYPNHAQHAPTPSRSHRL